MEEIAKTRVFTKIERDEYDALQSAYVLGEFEADLPPVPPEIRGQQLYPTGPVDPLIQLVLDDLKGRLVWVDGQLALIEGFSAASGDPFYVGAKGNVRWSGDLDTYSGDLFTETELRRLKEARRAAVDFTGKATQRNPDGPFIGGAKLVFADDIKPRIAEVIRGWIPLLQLSDIRLVVTTPESGRRMAEGQYGRFWRIGKAVLKGKNTEGVMQPLGNSDFHIAMRPSASTLQQLELVAHELGHILQRVSFEKLPVETRAKIQADYDKWLAENKPKLANEVYRSLRAYRTGKLTGGRFGFKTAEQVSSYYTSFSEWFADQVSKWATTQKKPLTVVDRFFKRLADALRKFFVGERAKFLPSGSMAEWLDSLSPDMTDALPNPPPPSVVETTRPKPEEAAAPPPPPPTPAPAPTAIDDPALAEVPRPEKLMRAKGERQRYPGLFWTSLESVRQRYMRQGVRTAQDTTELPERTLNITTLSQLPEAVRARMLRDFQAWVDRNYPRFNIENTYLYDVLVRGESDFLYPTVQDNEYLRSKGYDSVYFATEGGEDVQTWYVFDKPTAKTAEEIEAETAAARAEIEAERANAEEQWNNERLPSDVVFADLPGVARQAWQESDRSGAAQITIMQKLLDGEYALDTTVKERLNFALAAATAALDGANFAQFDAVIDVIVEVAYFPTDDKYTKEQRDEALTFLSDPLEFSDAHLEAIADSFVELAGGQTLETKTKAKKGQAGAAAGADKPWYAYAKSTTGVMQRLGNRGVVFSMLTDDEARAYVESTVLSRQNLPDAQAKRLFGKEVSAKEDAESDPKNSPLTQLLRLITDINKSTVPYTGDLVKRRQRELKALYAKVLDLDLDTTQVSPFFDAAGSPFTLSVNKLMRVVTKAEATKAEAARREAVLKEQEAANKATKTDTINSFDDFVRTEGKGKPGRNFVDIDGKPITKPLDIGRVRMVLANFLSKLAVKPKVYVFRDQADLKATNPRLYERAAAARPEGDFDRTPASGYAFGNNEVIIFTNRLKTEQHLRFVLAHETIGHIGLRSLIPKAQFDKLMLDIYDRSPGVQRAVDAAMSTRGLPKPEAVEEYLSDVAAGLDVSIINRVWNAIKGALNRLGVKFGDEAARYWVNHAREYVRTGRSSVFTVQDVVAKIYGVETGQDPDNVGRFAAAGHLRNDNLAAGLLYDNVGGMPSSLAEAWETAKGVIGNRQDGWDRFKAQVFSLFNFRARENPGLSALERLLSDARGLSMQIKNALNEKLAVVTNLAVADITAGMPGLGGITQDQLAQTNKLVYDAQRLAASRLKKLSDLGRTPLYIIDPDGGLTPNQPEIDRLYEQGKITFEQARDGFTYEDRYPGDDGKEVVEQVRVPGIPGLTKDSVVWQGYERVREAMRDVELALLRARYLAYTQDRDLAFREIAEVTTTGKLTAEETRFFERAYRKYRDLWLADKQFNEDGDLELNADSIDKANEFLVAFNTALLGQGTDRNAAVAAYFQGQQADDMVEGIQAFKSRFIRSEDTEFLIQNRIKDILIAEVSSTDADLYTKRTLATGYAPVLRRGGFQVRVVATVGGRVVRLRQDYKERLVYSQFEAQSDAVEMAKTINDDLFGGKTYKVEAYNEQTMRFEPMEVKLTAKAETALDAIAAPPDLNLNEFVRGLRQFSITLPPAKLKQVVVALTRQDNRARQRLQRGFVPGADPNAVRAVSEHIEARASTIAKVTMRPKLAELMNLNMRDTQALWNGDKDKLDKLKAAWDRVQADPAASVEQKLAAKMAYDEYAFMYSKTNPEGRPARGNQYYNEAARAVAFLDGNRDVGTSDFEAGRIASQVRAYTSFLQLGGSLATGALNYIGALTNSIPYLATYNEKTAFGGGHGFAKSLAQVSIALSQVGLVKSVRGRFADEDLSTAEFFEQVAKSKALQKRYGLTVDEAKFMAREIREGEMIPALTNSLVATARGRTTSGAGQKTIDTWMWTFNATEQAVRRAVGLAAYRMERQRGLAAGLPAEAAQVKAREAAVAALRFTLGDYAVMNRPPLWQNGIQSFVYMYKVFPTMTIQLLARLPRKGQLAMLGALWVLGGVAAFPFAEDLEDIIDTIAQALGLSMGSVRVELAKMIDTIMPGASPYVLRGIANDYFPGNIADRVSVGNFIPGTGIGLSGANVGRELTDIAGPALSMLTGVGQSAIDILRIPGETRTVVDVLRESPITMFRAMGDAVAYSQSGAIVDRRGYVVVPEVGPLLLATRLVGFYPSAASQQYDIIRAAKRITDYQKEKVAGFRHAWIQAKIQGDEDQARAVVEAVNRWNEGAVGTGLEIRNFLGNANRALREAQRPAGERFLRATPRAARDDLADIESLLGYTD